MRARRSVLQGAFLFIVCGAVAVLVTHGRQGQPDDGSATPPQRRFRGHTGILREIAFAPDSRAFATASVDGAVKLWSVPEARLTRTLSHPQGVTSVDFSEDGKWLVTGSYDGAARVWHLPEGRLRRTLHGHTGTIWSVATRGAIVATAGEDRAIRLWDLHSGALLRVLRGHERNVWSVAFSPDGEWLVSGGFDRAVKVWSVRTGALLRTLHGHRQAVVAVAYSRDGRLIASGGDDSTVRLWRARDGAAERVLSSGSDHVYSVAFSGDGRWLASGGRELGAVGTLWKQLTGNRFTRRRPTIRVWRVPDGTLAQALSFHSDDVWSVAISGDSQWLASNSADGTTALWPLSRLAQ